MSKKRVGVVDWPSTTYTYWPHLQKSTKVLLDTGSSASFFPEFFLRSLLTIPQIKTFKTVSSPFQVHKKVHVEFVIAGETLKHEFYVFNESMPIFGRDILRRLPFVMDLNSGQLLPKNKSGAGEEDECIYSCFTTKEDFLQKFDWNETVLSERNLESLHDLLWECKEAFSSQPGELGRVKGFEHSIDTSSASPVFKRPYRLAQSLSPVVDDIVEKMLASGVITPTQSPWSSPFLLVDKPDKSKRFVIDFRALNEVTVKDKYPLPLIDELLDRLVNSRLFSTLDLTSGYWQVPLHEDSKCKTAFQACGNQYQFEVLPFGLTNAPSYFQRMMNEIMKDLDTVPYIDDTIIHSGDVAQHLHSLKRVLMRVIEYGLKLNPAKCKFGKDKIQYLGFRVSNGQIFPGEKVLDKIRNFQEPKTPKQLQEFLGMCQFYHRFIPHFANLSAALSDISHVALPKFKRTWCGTHKDAFETLRAELGNIGSLDLPDFQAPFVIDIDASSVAMGSVIYQPNRSNRPIAFASKKFSKTERNYSTTDREFLALKWSVEKFHHYVYGRHFVVRSDHKPLEGLLKGKPNNQRQARYQMFLQDYDFDLKFVPGKENVVADTLSRAEEIADDCDINALRVEQNIDWKKIQEDDEETRKTLEKHSRNQASRGFSKDSKEILRYYGRIVVPETSASELVENYHSSGHFGVRIVRNSILAAGYWFRKMNSVIRSVLKKCQACTAKSYSPHVPWSTLPKAPEKMPFEFVSIDIVGPLSRQQDGSRFILTMIDHATRFLRAIPITNVRANTVAGVFLNHWVTIFGPPAVIHSDQGSQFESEIFIDLCKKLNIRKSRTTTYHPQGNGIVERVHRTLKDRLRTNSRSWSESLSSAVYDINRSTSNGFSPFRQVFDREGLPLRDWPKRPDSASDETKSFCPPHAGDMVALRVQNPMPLSPKFSGRYVVQSRPSKFVVVLASGRSVNIRNVKLLH